MVGWGDVARPEYQLGTAGAFHHGGRSGQCGVGEWALPSVWPWEAGHVTSRAPAAVALGLPGPLEMS